LPAEVAAYQRGVDLFYFSNVLLVNECSLNLLEFFMLRENSLSKTAISSCCGTMMCTIHPAAQGNSIVVDADNCRVRTPKIIETQAVFWGSDFPPEKYEALSKRDEIPKVFKPSEETHTKPMIDAVSALSAPIAELYKRAGSTTFESMCADKKLTVDNSFFEESRRGKPEAR
jgi:hypothetical protein